MNASIDVSKLHRFDVIDYLQTKQDIAEYLAVVIEDGDPVLLAATLNDIACVRGIAEIAKEAGIDRQTLHETLRHGNNNPPFDIVARVCKVLGMQLTARPCTPTVVDAEALSASA